MHVNRLRNVKSCLDNRAPKKFAHLSQQKKSQTRMLLSKHLDTQNENRILLKKMLQIDLKPSNLNPSKIIFKPTPSQNSLNRVQRLRELIRVNEENRMLLKRLQNAHSTYDKKKWDNAFNLNSYYNDLIRRNSGKDYQQQQNLGRFCKHPYFITTPSNGNFATLSTNGEFYSGSQHGRAMSANQKLRSSYYNKNFNDGSTFATENNIPGQGGTLRTINEINMNSNRPGTSDEGGLRPMTAPHNQVRAKKRSRKIMSGNQRNQKSYTQNQVYQQDQIQENYQQEQQLNVNEEQENKPQSERSKREEDEVEKPKIEEGQAVSNEVLEMQQKLSERPDTGAMISNTFKDVYGEGFNEKIEDLVKRYQRHLQKLESYKDSLEDIQDFPKKHEWLNTKDGMALQFDRELKNKIVVIDFWSSCCINCIHVLAEMDYLERRFKSRKEIVFVGCHSAKFDNEKDFHMLQQAVLRYNIEHPVFNDKKFQFWQENNVNCWPTIMVVGPNKKPILKITGEDHKDELEAMLLASLQYFDGKLDNSEIPIELEKDKLKNKKGELRPEQIKALRQNLNNPGKVIVIADQTENWPYQTSDIMVIADSSNNRYLIIDANSMKCLEVVGNGKIGFKDGSFQEAEFYHTQGMCHFVNQNHEHCLLVCDTKNHLLREVNLNKKTVRKVAGDKPGVRGFDLKGGKAANEQQIASPWDVNLMSENKFIVAMAGTHQIWIYERDKDRIVRFSGSGAEGNLNGDHQEAQWAQPSGITGGMWNGELCYFVADSESSCIRAINMNKNKVVGLVGGDPNYRNLFAFGDQDGTGYKARLQHPIGVHFSPVQKVLFVADSYNHKIKVMDFSKEQKEVLIKSWIGTSDHQSPSVVDGKKPLLNEPNGLWAWYQKGEFKGILVADTGNNCIRLAHMSGEVETLEITGIPDVRETASDCIGGMCEAPFDKL